LVIGIKGSAVADKLLNGIEEANKKYSEEKCFRKKGEEKKISKSKRVSRFGQRVEPNKNQVK